MVLRAEEPAQRRRRSAQAARGLGADRVVAEHRQPVAGCHAFEDPRFQVFNELPEDRYEAFLSVPVLCRGRLVAVINLQYRQRRFSEDFDFVAVVRHLAIP